MIEPRILIVDDTPTNIGLVASILEKEPYDLSFATSGQDALSQIQETPFDLILLDIMMPEMDGYSLCEHLKSQTLTQNIPIIFLTARSDQESMIKSFALGAADYVTKPFNPAELLARVKTHLKLKQIQNELQEKNEALQLALETKNRFLSIAAHDLRNPLSAVKGYTGLLKDSENVQTDDEALELVELIQKSINQMFFLLNDLLDTTALEVGKMELKPMTFPMHELVVSVLKDNRILADKKQQTLNYTPPRSSCLIEADPNRIKQIVDNLVNNAIKYSPFSSTVQLSLGEDGQNIYLTIQDQGPGFSADDQAKIYHYFQRLSAQPTGGESSKGLGLAIVKQIVELHQGEISLESAPRSGAKFTVKLPRAYRAKQQEN